jgi:hypothetical protein
MILCIKQYIIGHLEIMFLSWHYLTPNLLSNYGEVSWFIHGLIEVEGGLTGSHGYKRKKKMGKVHKTPLNYQTF